MSPVRDFPPGRDMRYPSPPLSPPRRRVFDDRDYPPRGREDYGYMDREYSRRPQKRRRYRSPSPVKTRFVDDEYQTLYVGGIPQNVEEAEVEELFSPFGPVYKIVLGYRDFGFVTMEKPDAENALRKLDGIEYRGKYLRLNYSYK